ncbi:hypothetical protein ACJJIW_20780 [Microbulbifer sp. JMSA004]|uniref:hypothetical protein n=1 Tax=unclassified Microbulbifer TaxID=2619833 RepID=UPI0024AD5B89|nr:hypothetical protein [Microbulbifer sp. VAAF005]WHI46434.1 hypothetical protein P0078_22435 [Microbulbifer sp. VAAF005]
MKRSRTKKNRRKNLNSDQGCLKRKFEVLEDVTSLVCQNWLWFCIFIFSAIWLGGHLWQAVTEFGIPNVRTTDIIWLKIHPFLFLVVFVLKLAFWFLSTASVIVFLKNIGRAK